jgi:hypothetical protein
MAKYKIMTYYEYRAMVEVEANTIEEALEKGSEKIGYMKREDLDYIDTLDTEVIDENGNIIELNEMED